MNQPISLLQLNTRISSAITSTEGLRNVWVAAETGDVRLSGGHCYLELIEKDPDNGRPLARLRAIIWASAYPAINGEFIAATGRKLESDLKVMVRITVTFHPAFGMSAVIDAIDPEYTCGDLIRRRRMMIKRLTDEGIIDMNRTLPLPEPINRIAVISSSGAAGYGDFINQLYHNNSRLAFKTQLFEATMQGEHAPESIIAALEDVAEMIDDYDCVVIIRGGGATGDLATLDNYDLAANVAQFPLPVIVGVGHDRDTTILDYVAAVTVKTPTAAAQWLISQGETALAHLRELASALYQSVTARSSGAMQQLAYYSGLLPSLAQSRIRQSQIQLDQNIPSQITMAATTLIKRHEDRLKAAVRMLEALSPQAVLRRGYSISRVNGHAVTDASSLAEGDVMTTTLADGSILSIVKTISK